LSFSFFLFRKLQAIRCCDTRTMCLEPVTQIPSLAIAPDTFAYFEGEAVTRMPRAC